ncbi:MAG: OB-fold nucleic acid binding domain-containing protein [Halobacteria archaeon]|nr:OB-fold nucleic acid binding domain-containing protein [Halobacteria archaeon]
MNESTCDVCGRKVEGGGDLCNEHEGTPVLYHLGNSCGLDEVDEGKVYEGEVNGVVDYGVFVDLNDDISGLIHESNLSESLEVGDEVKVRVSEIKDNGDIDLRPVFMHDYNDAEIECERTRSEIGSLSERVGEAVYVEGEVVRTKQTGGPTIFTVTDETGTVDTAAFVEAGVRAYPEIETGDFVRIRGEVETRDGDLQIEADEMEGLEGDERDEVEERIQASLDEKAEPPEIEPLIDADSIDSLYPGLRNVAKAIRKAVLTNRPIIVRHHADADGISSGVVVERAVTSMIDEVNDDPEAKYHLFSRSPSKAPFYEMEDVTRDLNYALKDVKRHGHSMPILVMLDNGSTEEDTPAYEIARTYDIPIYIVDHHFPDPDSVDPLVEEHVNPYLIDEDYSITSGMLCTELARLVNPDVEDEVRHVPAVSGKGDRSEADEMEEYVEMAENEGYDEGHLEDVADALDYEAFWLKYDEGRHLVNDILDVSDNDVHDELVEKLNQRADEAFERQISTAMPHVQEERLENGARLYTINVEKYAHKFTFPGPGKTTGEIHDTKVDETDDPVITIGYGPDFCVIRGHGVGIDIPQIVDELKDEIRGAGVDGGGHLVVGSIKFAEGMREEVLYELKKKFGEAPLKEGAEGAPDISGVEDRKIG